MRVLRRVLAVVLALAGAAVAPSIAAQPRSAQGDCVRELSRHGLTAQNWSNFRQLPNGWQVDIRARDSRGRNDTGTCMVFTNGPVRLFGFESLGSGGGGWGGGGNGMTFNCASKDLRYRECQMPIDGRVELRQRWSEARCDFGRSWGVRGDRVWVNHGCRAEFEVFRRGGGGIGGGGSGGMGSQVDCRSSNGRYQECRLPRDTYARLVRDHTGQCRLGQSWGTERGMVWVRANCQARFEAVRSPPAVGGGGLQPGPNNDRARAEAACRREASRMGYEVRDLRVGAEGGHTITVSMRLRRSGQGHDATCSYDRRSERAQVRVQPIPM